MKFENFFIETEINHSSISDIVFEQAVAEFEVSSKLLDYYEKQESILEFYDKQNLEPCEAFVEGSLEMKALGLMKPIMSSLKDKSKKAVDNAEKRRSEINSGFKTWRKNLFNMIRIAVDKFIDSLHHVNFKALARRVDKKFSSDTDFSNKISPLLFWTLSRAAYYTEKLLKQRDLDQMQFSNQIAVVQKLFQDFKNEITFQQGDGKPSPDDRLTKQLLIDKLKKADQDQKNIVGVRTLLRRMRLDEFDSNPDDIPAVIEKNQAFRKTYETFAKELANCFIKASKDIEKLIKIVGSKHENDMESYDPSKYVPKPSSSSKDNDDDVDNNNFNEIILQGEDGYNEELDTGHQGWHKNPKYK